MAFLGLSLHKNTTYHIQSVQLLNSNWMADPVQTAAMQGAVSGSGITEGVLGAIQSGTGFNLKQYYPYATRRFRKRNIEWNIRTVNTTNIVELGLNKDRVLDIIPSLADKEWRVISDVDMFSYSGAKTFEDIKKKYHWDSFTPALSDGTNIVITGAESALPYVTYDGDLGNSWKVGIETSKNVPVLILDPRVDKSKITSEYYLLAQEKVNFQMSGGIVYWTSSKGFESKTKSTPRTQWYSSEAYKNLGIKDSTKTYETNRITDWREEETTTIVLDTINDNDQPLPSTGKLMNSPKEKVTIFYQKLVRSREITNDKSGTSFTQYLVETWSEEGEINYDEEHYIWATQTGESHPGVRAYFKLPSTNKSSINNYGDLFKFYPYLPTREHGRNILDFSKAEKLTKALRNQINHAKETTTENDSPKLNRTGTRELYKMNKKSDITSETKRVLANTAKYARKVSVVEGWDIEPKDERHLVKLGDFLNLDYKETAGSMEVSEDSSKIYHNSLMPAVTLGSNFDEVNEYWYTFFKRIHRKVGKKAYLNFSAEVNKLPANCEYGHVYSLPRTEIFYNTIGSGQMGGIMGFAYTREFTLTGKIRSTKRKSGLKEVKIGLMTDLVRLKGKSLKQQLLHPSQEMVKNTYYTSPVSGKQYNVGVEGGVRVDISKMEINPDADKYIRKHGGIFTKDLKTHDHVKQMQQDKDRSDLMFAYFGYTFFCKQLANNKIHVIAVAGLTFQQHRTGFVTYNHGSLGLDGVTLGARAYWEMNMFWERNKKKYIEKVSTNQINVKTIFAIGSERHRLEAHVQTFFLMPLDFKTLSRMSGTSVMRLSDRAVVSMTWATQKVRTWRGWVKSFIRLVGLAITAIGAYFGASSAVGQSFLAIAKTIATAAVAQIAVKYSIRLLIKVFGIKGLIALIVAVVATTLAMVLGGFTQSTSLPYAHQLPSMQVAGSAFSQAQNTVTQSIMQNLKSMVQESMKSIVGDISKLSTKELLAKSAGLVSKLADEGTSYLNQQTMDFAKRVEAATKEYDSHMAELQELQELNQERTAAYDVKAVMASLMNKSKLLDPSGYLESMLLADNTLSSEEYIARFISNKLTLEPSNFDSIGSLDFSLTMKG